MHNDIKPPNILISPTGHLALADFGLAFKPGKSTRGGGTPGYEAPECFSNIFSPNPRVTQKADIWSAGVTILQMWSNSKDAKYWALALEEAKKGDAPYGAVIVKNNEVVAKGYMRDSSGENRKKVSHEYDFLWMKHLKCSPLIPGKCEPFRYLSH